jgi:uncharacterized LabA/DUF88 family protein
VSAGQDDASAVGDALDPVERNSDQPPFPGRRRLAVLFDTENTSHRIVAELLTTIQRHGSAVIRRAYGDWMSASLGAWKPLLAEFAIRPVQRFPNGTGNGKNATDIALVVDAMDLLHGTPLDGFCIVSSDSDFADLALRIKEAGLMVIGVGKAKTPASFQKCCTLFIPTDVRRADMDQPAQDAGDASQGLTTLQDLVRLAIRQAAADDGWAPLSEVGQRIQRPKGSPRLSTIVRGMVDVETKPITPVAGSVVLVRLRSGGT